MKWHPRDIAMTLKAAPLSPNEPTIPNNYICAYVEACIAMGFDEEFVVMRKEPGMPWIMDGCRFLYLKGYKRDYLNPMNRGFWNVIATLTPTDRFLAAMDKLGLKV